VDSARTAIVQECEKILAGQCTAAEGAKARRIIKLCTDYHDLDKIHDEAVGTQNLTNEDVKQAFNEIVALARYGFDVRPPRKR
jgi:hypothetical protein